MGLFGKKKKPTKEKLKLKAAVTSAKSGKKARRARDAMAELYWPFRNWGLW